MSRNIKGSSRSQATLFPEMLEDFVAKENPVRVIDVFVEGLDLENLGFKVFALRQQVVLVTIPLYFSRFISMVI
jgi:hypothetical protein